MKRLEVTTWNPNLYHLPIGSYHIYIEREWFDRYAPYMAWSEYDEWIPKFEHSLKVSQITAEYYGWKKKRDRQIELQQLEQDYLDSLHQSFIKP